MKVVHSVTLSSVAVHEDIGPTKQKLNSVPWEVLPLYHLQNIILQLLLSLYTLTIAVVTRRYRNYLLATEHLYTRNSCTNPGSEKRCAISYGSYQFLRNMKLLFKCQNFSNKIILFSLYFRNNISQELMHKTSAQPEFVTNALD